MTVIDSFRLDKKIALVSGGAGLYGRQIVESLAEAGARVIVASRNQRALARCVEQWQGDGFGISAEFLDLASIESIRALDTRIGEAFGGVDILINNAVARPMRGWSDGVEAFDQSMRINATGLFEITRVFAERMKARGGGSIINVGSVQGMVGPDFTLYEGLDMSALPDYFFHKSGMINFSRFAAAKLGTYNIRVNTISPGGLDLGGTNPRFVERYAQRTLLGRMGNSTDLKGVIVFLASDSSAYITGANIPVDGGYTAK